MKRFTAYVYVLIALACACGCNQYDIDEILISRDEVSLTVKGEPVFLFEPDNCQVAYNNERNEYRAMTDDMSDYFVLKAHEKLSHIAQEFTADLTYTLPNRVKKESGLVFTIEKISNDDGLVWLWCADKSIGLVVRVF